MYHAVVNYACKLQLFSSKVLWVYLMMQKMPSEINGLSKAGERLAAKTSLMVAGPSLSDCVKPLFLSSRLF